MENILFKYRTFEPWEHLLDILLNKRLFAASFEKLNDPMEGLFTYSKNQVSQGFIKQLVEEKSRIRICSLSQTWQSTLMWSYYASGHTGIVLGVEVDQNTDLQYQVNQVSYQQRISFKGYYGSDPEIDARSILSKKLSGWKHEKEVRVLTKKKFVPVIVRKVILGHRMSRQQRRLVKVLLSRIDSDIELEQMERKKLDTQTVL